MKSEAMRGILSALTATLCCLTFSCHDYGEEPQEVRTVVFMGQVSLRHESPYDIRSGLGVTVSLDGTSYSTMADSQGWWNLRGIPAGRYNIAFTKADYVTTRYLNFDFKPDTTVTYSSLGKVPSFNITSITTQASPEKFTVTGKLSNVAPYVRIAWVYFYSDSTVSNQRFLCALGSSEIPPLASEFAFSESFVLLRLSGFSTSGMRVYMAAYGTCGGSWVHDFAAGTGYETDVSPIAAKADFVMP